MVFIIAEIGINHNGDISIAKKLIDVAIEAGCDAVKFQKRTVEKVYSKEVLDSPRESPWGKTTREQKEGIEFSVKQYKIIDKYCKAKKIPWFVSCWDVDSQIQMQKFNLKDFWLSLGLVVIQHFPFFFNRYPLNGDDLEFGLAFTRVFYQQVESFSWGVSSLNGSFPLIAEGQIGFFHPLRWLVYLLPPWPDSSDVLAIAGEYVFLLILANLIMCYGMISLLRLKKVQHWLRFHP